MNLEQTAIRELLLLWARDKVWFDHEQEEAFLDENCTINLHYHSSVERLKISAMVGDGILEQEMFDEELVVEFDFEIYFKEENNYTEISFPKGWHKDLREEIEEIIMSKV